ncbi:MAG TPA: multiheme c-type cytochrome [Anaeromyxobacteraceae bacterium]|nr:multiheme c-type cytochrome [Anaeromyxobacteraceae bacterium]
MKRHLRTILAASLLSLAPGAVQAAGGVAVSKGSQACLECHASTNPGIVQQWKESGHAKKGVGCLECHRADQGDADAFQHNGALIATIVTPRDCARCHAQEDKEFEHSHHAKAGNILASLDNFLAETVEGARERFNPHAPAGGKALEDVNGMASAQSGCQNCHGTKVALQKKGGGQITVDDLKPGKDGRPANPGALAQVARDADGRPLFDAATWPNTGIGRINLDGSLGSCTACHSRHDFSPRRARQPENCGKCHLGPDHPQKEIFEESKHGIAYRDRKDAMGLDKKSWVLGQDYTAAPTCASCHMSANVNGGKVTHDPGERISWTNRPPISQRMDTDADHKVVTEADPAKRNALVTDTAAQKRERMKQACTVCHVGSYVDDFYKQYDDFERLYNEKFARPGKAIMDELKKQQLITAKEFDEKIEWDWFYLWHHEGRRARHGVSMNAPDYAHWHGMFEVAERFYHALVPEAREIARAAAERGKKPQADAVNAVIDGILRRPEHAWYLQETRSTQQVAPKGAAVEPQPPTQQTLGK